MMLYLLKSALLLSLLYGAFALLLSRETFHRLNRLALLCVLVASAVLPAIQITLDNAPFISYMNVGTLYVETNATTALRGCLTPFRTIRHCLSRKLQSENRISATR